VIRTLYAPGDPQRYVQPVTWTRDGDRLLVLHSAEDRTWQIGFMNADDGTLQILRSLDWRGPQGMDLSPDGQWIAYSLPREEAPSILDVFLLATDGSEEHLLAGSDASEEVVGWLPDGGPLFYLSDAGGTTRLLAQELDGARKDGPPRVVRSDMVHAGSMGAFRDGFLFGIAVEARQTRLGTVDLSEARLDVPLTAVVPARMERAVAPEWSADGEQLVYVVNPPQGGLSFPVRLAVRSVRTGAERRFAIPFGYVNNIALSPDGTELLVQGYGPEGQNGIFRTPLDGEGVEPVERNGIDADRTRIPYWSADGRSAYYARWSMEDGDDERIVRRDLETGELEELYRTSRLRGFAVSPDESEIAVTRHHPDAPEQSQLLAVDLATGTERELARVTDPEGFSNGSNLTWSPDGEHILYVQSGPDSDGGEVLRVVSRRGGEPKVIPTDQWVSRPRLHPDGGRLAVMAGVNRWEVWTLENVGSVVEDR
jgi:Tol biopolymer transport system component